MNTKYSNSSFSREPQNDNNRLIEREMCGVNGCQTYVGHGRYAPSFADVCFTLADGTRIARCAKCYTDQLYRTGKGTMSDITGKQPYLTPENVKAYWDKLDREDAERNAKRLSRK